MSPKVRWTDGRLVPSKMYYLSNTGIMLGRT